MQKRGIPECFVTAPDGTGKAVADEEIMEAETIAEIALAAIGITALLVTVAVAKFLGRRCRQTSTAVLIAGLTAPVGAIVASICFVLTDGPDGPPPGAVLLGNILVAAIALPFTLLVAALTLRFSRP